MLLQFNISPTFDQEESKEPISGGPQYNAEDKMFTQTTRSLGLLHKLHCLRTCKAITAVKLMNKLLRRELIENKFLFSMELTKISTQENRAEG